MHTCGQLTVFKAFFGLGTGTPPKATNQQKFVTRPAWTARVEVSAAFGIGAAPTLFNHGSLTLGWFATTLVAGKPSREPGHWPANPGMLVHPGCYLSWTGKKTEHKRYHSPPVSELRPCRISQMVRFRWDFYSKLDDGKDRGQLWSDLIPSTSLGDCHALLGVTGKKSSGLAPRRSPDPRCAVRMAPRGGN